MADMNRREFIATAGALTVAASAVGVAAASAEPKAGVRVMDRVEWDGMYYREIKVDARGVVVEAVPAPEGHRGPVFTHG